MRLTRARAFQRAPALLVDERGPGRSHWALPAQGDPTVANRARSERGRCTAPRPSVFASSPDALAFSGRGTPQVARCSPAPKSRDLLLVGQNSGIHHPGRR